MINQQTQWQQCHEEANRLCRELKALNASRATLTDPAEIEEKKKDIENNAKRILGLETKKFKSHLSGVLSQASIDLAKKNALEQLNNNRELHDRYINEAIDEIDRIGL